MLHHVVEVSTQVTDVVVSVTEPNLDVQIAIGHVLNFVLQLQHWTPHHHSKSNQQDAANDYGARASHEEDLLTLMREQGERGEQEHQNPVEKSRCYWD